ncbi:flagellar filament capping protein FliD [Heliobacterium chlorum]|uniref:Flagellar hook-associated protein 2 n=1 Tax=Heliobacterium chlorum TaxID=2698 RepID=A0ABR7T0Z4_HELCL|nr:flagellar filament capping protein FliD [Heliobacterium chlorum]MBC9784457.1 flagellar filament capping protein FliD [Heliobacterium chlorum]
MSGSIQLGGIVSGLDTQSIIDQLMAVESKPLTQLQSKKQTLQFRKDAYTEFKLKMNSLRDKAEALYRTTGFSATTGTSSDTSVATVKPGTNAVPGSYKLQVSSLATSTRVSYDNITFLQPATSATLTGKALVPSVDVTKVFSNYASGDPTGLDQVKSGKLTINGVSISIIEGTDSINTVLNKINDSAAGVTASWDDTNHKMVLTQKTAGSSGKITVSTTANDSSNFLAAMGLNTTGDYTVTAGTDGGEKRALSDLTPAAGAFQSGFFKINGYTISYTTSDSVQSIINKINKGATGVTAFYAYDSSTGKGSISFTSEKTGADQTVKLEEDPSQGNFLHLMLGNDPSNPLDYTALTQAGTNAQYKINDVDMSSSSNAVTFNGMDISLLKSGATSYITINPDQDKILQNIKDFVSTYNSTVDYLYGKLSEKKVTDPQSTDDLKKGLLKSESVVRDAYTNLRRMVSSNIAGMPAEMNSLSDIGITGKKYTDDGGKSGQLSIDEDKLKEAISTNLSGVMALFQTQKVQVADEQVGPTTAGKTDYQLAKKNLYANSFPTSLSITDGSGTSIASLNYVTGTPAAGEFTIDLTSGILKLGTDPGTGNYIKNIYYSYNPQSDYEAGYASRFKFYTNGITKSGGSLDAVIGSDGSIANEISQIDDDIDALNKRLEMKKETYTRKFTAMEAALSKLKSQTSSFTSMLS